MIRAKLVDFYSSDVEDLSSYIPEDEECFSIQIQFTIGMVTEKKEVSGEESFELEVLTPKWLLSNYDKNETIFPENMLIVFEYDFERIYNRINSIIETSEGDSWDNLVFRLRKFARWEFEGYRE